MLFDEVKEILADQLEISAEDIDLEARLADDLGMGEMDAVDIAMTIEEQYSFEVTEEALDEIDTVEDLLRFIEANLD